VSKQAFVVGIVLVLLIVGSLFVGCGQQGQTGQPPSATPERPSKSPAAPLTSGATGEDVPVVIEAYYPLNEGHKFIADYLLGVGKANPETIRVTVYDMQTQVGREHWANSGLSCAGVFVNGSTRHELQGEGGPEVVNFLQRMDVFWNHEDFEAVLAQEFAKAGKTFNPPPPPVPPEPEETTPAEQSAESGP